ncbi:hypothetical protein [Thiohalomonas denitrificans]|uniref:Uncharacterized protein n=1 Tax=Thiohalomonas denitrificans TaxID=415747 RepID=A0A1G5QP31_9GAMM|nr:hypothetical protein [Thiohalomonas denitrificans]SCZ62879.1 hypothetical protein SAMN03097708_02373 [Thiohalomonas denitrificans]
MSGRIPIVSAIALVFVLNGCGGGGGGSVDDPGTPEPSTTVKSVSGSITLSSGGEATAGKSAEAAKGVAPETASITIHSYESDGTLSETRTVAAESVGVFSSQITLHNEGGYLVVDVKSPGTTGWSKRVNYSEPADVDLNAVLRTAQTQVQNLDSPLKANAEGGVFSFGVVRYADGTRKAVAGTSALKAAKAAEGAAGMDLEIAIPQQALPDTDTLRANLVTFDPNNAEDARSFPGDYIDSDGNRLVSVAFDSIEVTDEAGSSVAALAQDALETGRAVKSAETDVTVRRWIPYESCASVDSFWSQTGPSGESNGNTIPIYTYSPVSGSWILLGDGTVQTFNGSDYDEVSTFDSTSCTNGDYYLNIHVSSEEYINAWWNLDYPLMVTQPTEVCVDITFTDDSASANPLSGLYAELSGAGLSRVSASTKSNGVVTLNSVVTENDIPSTAMVSYWNPYDYSYQTKTDVPLGAKEDSCATHTVEVAKPKSCYVSGTVTKNGEGVANEYVWAYSTSPYSYGWAYTGSDGGFETRVACDVEMELFVGDIAKTFRVNDVINGDENSDGGDVADMGTIAKPNTVPTAYGYLSSTSVKANTTTGTASATAYVYGYDADGAEDYPLSYTLEVGESVHTGSITQADSYQEVKLTDLVEGEYPVSLTVTDGKDEGQAALGTLSVAPADANRPPVITYAYASVGTTVRLNRDGSLPLITLYAYAYDPDGGTTTGSWSCDACVGDFDPAGAFQGTASAGDTLTFTYTADDGGDRNNTATRTTTVEVLAADNKAPYFTSTTQSATTVSELPANIDFAVTADDDDQDELSFVWKVDGTVVGTGDTHTFAVPDDATDGQSFTIMVEVDDGYVEIPTTHTFTVTYSEISSETEVIIR